MSARSIIGIGTRALVALMAIVNSSGCQQPVYNKDLGITGVPIDDGALQGTFAVLTVLSDQAETAIGTQDGGGETTYLMTRDYDAGDGYTTTLRVCRVVNYTVAGLSSEIGDATRDAIPTITQHDSVQHGTGAFAAAKYREVWGLSGLDDAAALPRQGDDSRIFDLENDGHPGATLLTHGLVEGALYFVQRKTVAQDGVVLSSDEVVGLTSHKKDSFVIDATSELLLSSTNRQQHPDPKESWFHEVRVADDATCASVRAQFDAGDLSDLRPF